MNENTDEPRVERDALLQLAPREAWEAISSPSQLERWLAEEVELEPTEGAPARFLVDGTARDGEVREVVEGERISFTWRAPEEPATLVELELEPVADRLTRVRVRETAPAGAWCELRAVLFSLDRLTGAQAMVV